MLLDKFVKEYEGLKTLNESSNLSYPDKERFDELTVLKKALIAQDFKYEIYKKHVMG